MTIIIKKIPVDSSEIDLIFKEYRDKVFGKNNND